MSRLGPESPLSRKAAWASSSEFLLAAGQLVCMVIAGRVLGSEGLGRLALALWLVELAGILTAGGLQTAMTRYVAGEASDAEPLARRLFHLQLWTLPLGLLAAWLGAQAFYAAEVRPGIDVLLLLVLFRQLRVIYVCYLKGRQQHDRVFRLNLASIVLQVAGVAWGTWHYGLNGALYGYLAGHVVHAVLSFRLLGGRGASPEPAWKKFAGAAWLSGLLSIISSWSRVELLALDRWQGLAEEAGLFAAALYCASFTLRGGLMLGEAFLPHFSYLHGREPERLAVTYRQTTRFMACLLLPVSFGGAGLCPFVLPWMFGTEFAGAGYPAMALMLASGVIIFATGSSLVYGMGKSAFIAWSGLVSTAVFLIACAVLIPRYALWGAVMSRGIGQVLSVTLGLCYIQGRLKIATPWGSVARTAIAAAASGACAYAVLRQWTHPWMLVPAIAAGGGLYLLAFRSLNILPAGDWDALKRWARRGAA